MATRVADDTIINTQKYDNKTVMKKFTDECLENIYNNVTIEWIMDNPVSVKHLILDLIDQCFNTESDDLSIVVGDDIMYEQDLEDVNKYEYEVERYYKLKHSK